MTFLARVQSRFSANSRRSTGEDALDVPLRTPAALTLVLFAVSLGSIEFTRNANAIPSIWPSNAILLAFLLRSARASRNYGLIFLAGGTAMTLANLAGGNSLPLSTVVTIGHIVEVAAAWVLLALFQNDDCNLTRIRNLSVFMVLAGGLAPLLGASIGATAVAAAHEIPWLPIWLDWYASDALGMIIVAPFLLSLRLEDWHALRIQKRYREAAGVLALIVAVAVAASYYRISFFMIAPALLFATFRFGIIGAAMGTLVFAFAATVFTVNGIGPAVLSQSDLSVRILVMQIFLAATVFWSLPVAAVLAERDRLLADLSSANARLTEDGEKKSEVVVGLHRRLVNAEERERLRLSHELHDQTGESLTAAMLELKDIEPLVTEESSKRLQLLQKRMAEIGKTLHRVAWELRPASIDEYGLASALRNYMSEWRAQYEIEIDLYLGDDLKLDDQPDEVRATIFRVAQEGLTNVARHARGATSVSVVIECANAMIRLVIEDNGCGFDTGAAAAPAESRNGFGLTGMRERLLFLGGELEIQSSAGAGTTIFARIPFKPERMMG